MDAMQAIGAALDDLYKLRMVRANCNGWRNLAELLSVLGRFAEDNLDEVVSFLHEAAQSVKKLAEENTELKERLEKVESELYQLKQKNEKLECWINASL